MSRGRGRGRGRGAAGLDAALPEDVKASWRGSWTIWKMAPRANRSKLPFFSYGRDGHQAYSRVLCTHYKDSLLKDYPLLAI